MFQQQAPWNGHPSEPHTHKSGLSLHDAIVVLRVPALVIHSYAVRSWHISPKQQGATLLSILQVISLQVSIGSNVLEGLL